MQTKTWWTSDARHMRMRRKKNYLHFFFERTHSESIWCDFIFRIFYKVIIICGRKKSEKAMNEIEWQRANENKNKKRYQLHIKWNHFSSSIEKEWQTLISNRDWKNYWLSIFRLSAFSIRLYKVVCLWIVWSACIRRYLSWILLAGNGSSLSLIPWIRYI